MKKTDQQITGLYIAGTIQERTRRMVPADHPTTEIVTYTVIDQNDKRYYIDDYAPDSYYIDDYAPDSYHEVGDYAVIPVFIKPFRKKNGDPSYSLSVQKAYRHHSKGESF